MTGDPWSVGFVVVHPRVEPVLVAAVRDMSWAARSRLILGFSTRIPDIDSPLCNLGAGDFVTPGMPANELEFRFRMRVQQANAAAVESVAWGAVSKSRDGVGEVEALRLRLTPKEQSMYALFVERFGLVVSREEIEALVWRGARTNSRTSNIVDVYVRYLRVKLGTLAPQVEVATVRGAGYRMQRRGG